MSPPRLPPSIRGWICLLLVFVVKPATAFACSCAGFTWAQGLKDDDLVFHGRLLETSERFDLAASLDESSPDTWYWHRWLDTGSLSYLKRVFRVVLMSQQENRFRVLAVYKGSVDTTVTVRSPVNDIPGNCNFPFLPGQEYMVFARSTPFGLMSVDYFTSMCTATDDFSVVSTKLSLFGPARPPTFQPRTVVVVGLLAIALGGLGGWLKKRRTSAPA